MRFAILFLLLASACSAQEIKQSVVNWAVDLRGVLDERYATWGCTREEPCQTKAESVVYTIKVDRSSEAQGRRIRVLKVYGTSVLWPQGTVEPGRFAGVLVAIHSGPYWTTPGGHTWFVSADGESTEQAARAQFGESGTLYTGQWATGGGVEHARISEDVSQVGLLGPDGLLRSKLAVWMNSTGRDIHFEIQLVIVWQFEPAP